MNPKLELAHQYCRENRFRAAETICQGLLAQQPNLPDALHLLGIIYRQLGELDRATEYFRRAIAENPAVPDFYCNFALALTAQQNADGAIQAYRRAVELKPDFAEAYFNLGILLREQGQLDGAAEALNAALRGKPDFAAAHNSLGNVLKDQGELAIAEQQFQRALDLDPSLWSAHYNLATLHARLKQVEPAIEGYLKALQLNPNLAPAEAELAELYFIRHRWQDAVNHARQAIRLAPTESKYWQAYMRVLRLEHIHGDDARLRDEMTHYLSFDGIGDHDAIAPITAFIKRTESFRALVDAMRQANEADFFAAAMKAIGELLPRRFIEKRIIRDQALETVLTKLRRLLLLRASSHATGTALEKNQFDVAVSIAQQCFMNEYVWAQDAAETQSVALLTGLIQATARASKIIPMEWIVLLAAYRPIHGIAEVCKHFEHDYPAADSAIKTLVHRQIMEPLLEQTIRPNIKSLTAIHNTVSEAVREQYEQSPYPRWIDIERVEPQPVARALQALLVHFKLEDAPFPPSPNILVAGCGTGKHAIYVAWRFLGAQVLAVDLSLSSLAYGIRRAGELGVTNIEFRQADILELNGCGRTFDLIESAGVLHHLADPVAGWRTLTGILRPGGLMKIGLYSEIARRPIVAARKLIEQQGYGSTIEEIRRFRQEIYQLPDQEMAGKVASFGDFYTTPTCRDLLFHVQEHRFTLPEIDRILPQLGLKFLGFEIKQRAILDKYWKFNPDDSAAVSLPDWHEFELANPGVFAGMYQFWVMKIK